MRGTSLTIRRHGISSQPFPSTLNDNVNVGNDNSEEDSRDEAGIDIIPPLSFFGEREENPSPFNDHVVQETTDVSENPSLAVCVEFILGVKSIKHGDQPFENPRISHHYLQLNHEEVGKLLERGLYHIDYDGRGPPTANGFNGKNNDTYRVSCRNRGGSNSSTKSKRMRKESSKCKCTASCSVKAGCTSILWSTKEHVEACKPLSVDERDRSTPVFTKITVPEEVSLEILKNLKELLQATTGTISNNNLKRVVVQILQKHTIPTITSPVINFTKSIIARAKKEWSGSTVGNNSISLFLDALDAEVANTAGFMYEAHQIGGKYNSISFRDPHLSLKPLQQ